MAKLTASPIAGGFFSPHAGSHQAFPEKLAILERFRSGAPGML